MKNRDFKKQLSLLLLSMALILGFSTIASSDSLFSEAVEVSASHNKQLVGPKQQAKIALNYVNQPPMVPHSVEGYQLSVNTNSCLNCHSVQASRVTGAVRISPTHFLDAAGKTLSQVAPRRYFCLQCHLPQTDAAPIIDNIFQPELGFGQ